MSIAEVAKPAAPQPGLETPKMIESHPLISQWIAFDPEGRARRFVPVEKTPRLPVGHEDEIHREIDERYPGVGRDLQ